MTEIESVIEEVLGDGAIEKEIDAAISDVEQELGDEIDTLLEDDEEPDPIEKRLILPHLDRLTFDDLQYVARKIDTYRDAVQSMLEQKREERLKELQERIERDRAELAALSPVPVPTAKSKLENPSTPKYRDPAKPENTWAGRGKKPTWLHEKLESGAKLEDFLIDKPVVSDQVPEDTGF